MFGTASDENVHSLARKINPFIFSTNFELSVWVRRGSGFKKGDEDHRLSHLRERPNVGKTAAELGYHIGFQLTVLNGNWKQNNYVRVGILFDF